MTSCCIQTHSVAFCQVLHSGTRCSCVPVCGVAVACIRVHSRASRCIQIICIQCAFRRRMHAHALECALIRRNVLGQHPRDALQLCVLIRRALHLLCEGLGQCCRMYDNGIFCIMQRYKNANRCNIMQVAPGMHQNAQVS